MKKRKVQVKTGELNELLRDFYTITKIRIVAFDDSFEKLAAYPTSHSTYCEVLRRDKKAKEKCRECDLNGYKKSKKMGEMYIYQCFAGLTEVVVPLRDRDAIIGYLHMGQVILEDGTDREEKWQKVLPVVKDYEIELTELKECFWRKRRFTEQNLLAAAKIMEACASHLYLKKAVFLKEEDLSKQIETYIEDHLWDEITVESLCREFGIRRTKLYEISMHSFGDGITQYIRRNRIRKAEKLLGESDRKIAEIAELVGFPDYNYFTKVFKKETGFTPREYRRNFFCSDLEQYELK